jgi:hypothetical protein
MYVRTRKFAKSCHLESDFKIAIESNVRTVELVKKNVESGLGILEARQGDQIG